MSDNDDIRRQWEARRAKAQKVASDLTLGQHAYRGLMENPT